MEAVRTDCGACGTVLVDEARFCHHCGRAVTAPAHDPATDAGAGLRSVLVLAVGAALAIKAPALFGASLDGEADEAARLLRNVAPLVLPFVAVLLARRHREVRPLLISVAVPFVVGVVAVNAWPSEPLGDVEVLAVLHLPVLLWLAVGVAHAGDRWRTATGRLAFVRFTGEWIAHLALLALGGLLLTGLTAGAFEVLGLDVDLEEPITAWVLPCGAAGATVVAAWMADRRLADSDGIAPTIARAFTPLFALLFAVLLVAVAASGDLDVDRDALLLFDALLLAVVALLLVVVAGRDAHLGPTWFDRIQLATLACAVLVDLVAVGATAGRLLDDGFTANRTAAVGLNLLLLAHLAASAWWATSVLRGRRSLDALLGLQARFLPAYAAWAAAVVLVFPPLFGFA